MAEDSGYKIIEMDDLHPGKFQLREDIAEELKELAESIRMKGVLQPICVTPDGSGYEIIWGHRRYFASMIADMKDIPCHVKKNVSIEDKLQFALIENAQRKQLNPIEEAKTYKQLLEKLKITQEELGIIAGKNRPFITHTLRLLNLPKEIQAGVSRDTISPGHARALLRIEDKELQLKVFMCIIEGDLSVRKTEELVEKLLKEKKKRVDKEEPEMEMLLHTIWNWLSGNLGIDVVNIKVLKKRRVLELSFGSAENLMELIDRFSELKLDRSELAKMQKTYEKRINKGNRNY
jgi:ParB family transcriptional regulator, chromosome partitioning protein